MLASGAMRLTPLQRKQWKEVLAKSAFPSNEGEQALYWPSVCLKGWDEKQPLMRDTEWVGSEGTTHLKKIVFVEADRIKFPDGPVSRLSTK